MKKNEIKIWFIYGEFSEEFLFFVPALDLDDASFLMLLTNTEPWVRVGFLFTLRTKNNNFFLISNLNLNWIHLRSSSFSYSSSYESV